MPILRAQKESLIEKISQELTDSRVSLIVAYNHLDSASNTTLRDRAYEQSGKIRMLSNNLIRLILKDQKKELELPEKTLALAYGFTDEVVAAKVLVEFAKETDKLEILGGWVGGQFFDSQTIKTLASLPGQDQLRAQLVGRLNGLICGLVYDLNYPLQKLAFVVRAVANVKSKIENPK